MRRFSRPKLRSPNHAIMIPASMTLKQATHLENATVCQILHPPAAHRPEAGRNFLQCDAVASQLCINVYRLLANGMFASTSSCDNKADYISDAMACDTHKANMTSNECAKEFLS
eukprot:4574569-Amphidinium_carterae.1